MNPWFATLVLVSSILVGMFVARDPVPYTPPLFEVGQVVCLEDLHTPAKVLSRGWLAGNLYQLRFESGVADHIYESELTECIPTKGLPS